MSQKSPSKFYLHVVGSCLLVVAVYEIAIRTTSISAKWLVIGSGAALWAIWFWYSRPLLEEFGILKKKPLPDDYKLPEPDKPLVTPGDTRHPVRWIIIMIVLFYAFAWLIGGILYYFPPDIFDGRAFMETEVFNALYMGYIVLFILAANFGGYKYIRAFFRE